MKKLTIRLESPLDKTFHYYSEEPFSDGDAAEIVEYLNLALPKLLDDAIALFTNVKAYTEEVEK